MRLFVGIPLAAPGTKQLAAACRRLRAAHDGLRWSAPESWHITLQFLGSSTAEQFDCLTARLAEVRSGPVPVRLGGLVVFERAGVLAAEVELTPELALLAQRVTAATAPCGFQAEERPYHPHITLARAKGAGGRRQLKSLENRAQDLRPVASCFLARGFLLYESHLGPGGSKYEIRQRFNLAPVG